MRGSRAEEAQEGRESAWSLLSTRSEWGCRLCAALHTLLTPVRFLPSSSIYDPPICKLLTAARHLRCGALFTDICHTADPSVPDIIDESLQLFRANSLFRNFEIKTPADRALIYLILFIGDCLGRIAQGEFCPRRGGGMLAPLARRLTDWLSLATPPSTLAPCRRVNNTHSIARATARSWTHQEALKQLTTHSLSHFSLPGEPGFPLNQVFTPPSPPSPVEKDALRSWLVQARQETVARLLERHVYSVADESTEGGRKPSKWWMAFSVSGRS